MQPAEAQITQLFYLSDLDGTNGVIIVGPANSTQIGNQRAEAAGDINGDGRTDLIINHSEAATEGAFVVWGRSSLPQWVDLSDVSATNRSLLTADVEAGDSASGLGDINNDGYWDIGITDADSDGHPGLVQNDSGSVYVVFGTSAGFPASLNLTSLNGTTGFQLHGASASDTMGLDKHSLSGAGDVNGDGFADFVVTAEQGDGPPAITRNNAGEAFLIFGRSTAWAAETDISALVAGTQVVTMYQAEALDKLSRATGVGDVNGDGLADFVLGAGLADGTANGKQNAGECYLVFGRTTWPTSFELSSLDGSTGVTILPVDVQDRLSYSMSALGDFNGDGLADILVSTEQGDGPANARTSATDSYVVFGKTSWTATLELSSLNGTNGFAITGSEANDLVGVRVSAAGDFNGDGFHDILLGGPGGDAYLNSLTGSGEAFLLFGRTGTWSPINDVSLINGTNGIRFIGPEAGMSAGTSVGPAGDFNNDGLSDILIQAPNGDGPAETRTAAGEVYVVFGRTSTISATYRSSVRSGNPPGVRIGRLENGTEWQSSSRILMDYTGGSGAGPDSTSTETVEVFRTVEGLTNISRSLSPKLHWRLSSTRTGASALTIRANYSDAEAAGLDRSLMRLGYSSSTSGPWTWPTQTINPTNNFIQAAIPPASLPCYMVITNFAAFNPQPAPTAVFALTSGNPTPNELVDITINFDRPVLPTFTTDDITLAGTLAGSAVLYSLTGPAAGDVYTARILLTNQTANGTIGITIPANVVSSDFQINYAGGSSSLYTISNSGVVNCADIDKNGTLNVADVTTLANHIINGTPLP